MSNCTCGGTRFHETWDGCIAYLREQNALLGVEVRSYIDAAVQLEERITQMRKTLALHHSMVLCGEKPSTESEQMFTEAMG
jgi:hypothetical protein